MIKVPIAVKPWAHDFEIVHDVKWELTLLCFLLRITASRICSLLYQEAIESAVTRRHHIAHLHLFGKWAQIEPDLLLLTVHVYVGVHLLLTPDVLELDWLLKAFIDHLA